MMKRYYSIIFGIIALISLTNVAYAEELTYEQKILFASEKEQIIGHIISAINSIQNEDYDVAKMHLMHPLAINFPIIQSIVSENNNSEINKLELSLKTLTFIDPKNDYVLLKYKLKPIFTILAKTEQTIIGEKLQQDTLFQLKLIESLLEKSMHHNKEYLELDDGVAKETKKQDSLSLAIKSHMILSKISIEGDDIKNDFADLFLAYEFNLEQVATLEQKIIDKINKKIIKNGDLSKYDVSKDINEPIIFLKKISYLSDNNLIEFHAQNFEKNQTYKIEYVSPNADKIKIIEGKTNEDGIINIRLEFSQNTTESYLISILSGAIEIYEVLFPE